MWKPNQPGSSNAPGATPEAPRPTPTPTAAGHETPARPAATASSPTDQATIGKSLVIKGEVSGSESLYIDGRVEGSINLPGNRVTVGRNGNVSANISAREVVVLGKVKGNLSASDRVDIRSEGSLTGDVVAQRISIEDGAFFKGGIDIRKPGQAEGGKAAASGASTGSSTSATNGAPSIPVNTPGSATQEQGMLRV
jgi:cytoskeletal protein CcmA (bactofilin family)